MVKYRINSTHALTKKEKTTTISRRTPPMPPSGMEVRPLLMEVRSPRAEKMLVAENMRLLQKIDELEKQLIKQQQETLRVRADVDRQGSASASDHWELSMGHAQQALARCFQPRHSPLPTSPQRPGSPSRRQHESLHGRKSVLPDWTSKTEKDLLKRESLGIVGDPFVEKAAKKLSDTPLEEHEYVLEDEWDFTNTNGVINPNSEWKTRWDFIIMFLIIYSAIVVPFRICFSAEAEGIMWNLEVVASFIFIVDVIFNFNTAYFAEEKLVISRPRIVSRYFSGGQRHPLRQRHSLPLRLRRFVTPFRCAFGVSSLPSVAPSAFGPRAPRRRHCHHPLARPCPYHVCC